jgi:hypothetical protein
MGDAIDTLLFGYGRRLVEALVSEEEAPPGAPQRYLTGRRLVQELGHCNFTALTHGDGASVNRAAGVSLLHLLVCTLLLFVCLTTFCIPSGTLVVATYALLFPMVFFWLAYGVSPLCWPMIPPRLPHDLAVELGALIPDSFEIPQFLVRDGCTVRGRLSDGSAGDAATCFKRCADPPFQMLSWQDPLAWFLCDFSTALCLTTAEWASRWDMLQDYTSSATYYAEVVRFQALDPDFAGAHRLCAFFKSYELCLAAGGLVFACLMLPYVLTTIAELFAAALLLLVQAYSAETALHGDDD